MLGSDANDELIRGLLRQLNELKRQVTDLASLESGGGGASVFLDLTDVPGNYTGDARKLLAVNSGETAVEFVDSLVDTLTFHDNGDSTKKARLEISGVTAGQTRVLTVPNFDGTLATLAGTETFTNKTLTAPTVTIWDNSLTIQDEGDLTKQFKFQASGITAGNTRTYTVPNFDGTLATLAGTETLTNKTLTNPTITMRDSVLVLQDEVDNTKQFKIQVSGVTAGQTRVLTVPDFDGTIATLAGTETLTNKTLTSPTITVRDNVLTLQDEGDNTKQMQFQLSGITTGNTRTLTVPNASGTLALLGLAQTFSALQTFSSGINLGNESLTVYDEGTWTPAIEGSGSNPTVTYGGTLSGTYRRFNDMVFYSFRIPITTISGGSGDIRITLPFTAVTPTGPAALRISGVDVSGTPITVVFNPNSGSAYGLIYGIYDNGAEVAQQISGLANGDSLQSQGFFFV